ncbi:MbeB family mobilization protein [Candidatus Williamhamiltonella defendens]|uniref:MbeB family mobilization protein n=1 Tax=Candidatus Williamhamiltonella defendens TaxID=138072 RepID=UPI00387E684A
MSRILDLAETFSQSVRQDSEIMTEKVKLAIEQHERDLKVQLQNASRNLSESIRTEQIRLIRRTVIAWKLPFIILLVLALVLMICNLLIGYWAKEEYQNMKAWERSSRIYQKESNYIKLSNCTMDDKTTRACVAVDPKYEKQVWGQKEPSRS